MVTAAHVVEDAIEDKTEVQLKFYNNHHQYSGIVIRNYIDLDLALIEVAKPPNFTWTKNCLGIVEIGADVGFVGRNGGWYIPRGRALGTINRIDQNKVVVDINSVIPGTSGAPLIANSGIVGMILDSDGIEISALEVKEIKQALSEYEYFFQLVQSSENNSNNSELLTDRQGNQYTTKIMKDGKRWMTQNLNVEVDSSWCYDNDPKNCEQYGRLYTWEGAKEACKLLGDGWKLPSDEAWTKMIDHYGGARYGNATDEGESAYNALFDKGGGGFGALLGGIHGPGGESIRLENYGYYWSSSEVDDENANYYYFHAAPKRLVHDDFLKSLGFSCRCIKE